MNDLPQPQTLTLPSQVFFVSYIYNSWFFRFACYVHTMCCAYTFEPLQFWRSYVFALAQDKYLSQILNAGKVALIFIFVMKQTIIWVWCSWSFYRPHAWIIFNFSCSSTKECEWSINPVFIYYSMIFECFMVLFNWSTVYIVKISTETLYTSKGALYITVSHERSILFPSTLYQSLFFCFHFSYTLVSTFFFYAL